MNQERIYKVLLGPHISEKATNIADDNNQVTFRVVVDATQKEIKQAVETLFKVEVVNLQVVNVKGKTKRSARGKIRRRPSWKKAYVRLEQGHEIDFAELG